MIDYAIVLYFDKNSEKSIYFIQNAISDSCGNNYMIEHNIPPHITISLFSRETHNDILDIISSFAEQTVDFQIQIPSIGIFNSDASVLNVLPVVTDQLKKMNHDLNTMLAEKIEIFHEYYVEPNWVPHCAIAVKLNKIELMSAVSKICTIFSPLTVKINRIALVKCNPYKEISVWHLNKVRG